MKRTYGLQVEFLRQHYGVTQIVARVLAREDDAPHPINCNNDGEHEIWGAPKHLRGLMLCGLQVRAFFREDMCSVGDPQVEIAEASYIDVSKAKAMTRALVCVNSQLAKQHYPSEHGAVVQAVIKAFKLDWCVICTHASPGGSYSMSEWKFVEPDIAVKMYRSVIEANLKPRQEEVANDAGGL